MKMNGERFIPAPQQAVWEALNDPQVLKECVPGAQSIDRVSDTEFAVVMLAKVGPVSATFKGKIRLSDIVPPDSYKIAFDGQGGAAGFGKGQAAVALAGSSKDGVAGTQMKYDVDASVGGKLAQIGSRLIDGAASKIADDFFARFEARFTPVVVEVVQDAAPEQGFFARLLAWLRGLFK